MKHIFSKIIRILTIPPLMALLTFLSLYFHGRVLINVSDLLLAIFTITVLPIMGYIIQPFVGHHIHYFSGREGQRKMAMFFCVAGYVIGMIVTIFINPNREILLIYLGYFISGMTILICNLLGFRLSGHAVGAAGPVAILLTFHLTEWIIGLVLIFFVMVASLKMKRHKTSELVAGILLPFILLPILQKLLGV
ncbi:MAG: hypothetical protein Q4Q17_00985 [Tissierellia bacterium]|nr:hypothetical protein [Tissierellia bacterium]